MNRLLILALALFFGLSQCTPKEDIQFVEVKNVAVETNNGGEPLIKGNAVFFNPNKLKMKLRKADIEVFVNDKKSATVQQVYNLEIPSKANFTVPVEAKLSLKEFKLSDAVMGIFGGKKYKVRFVGNIYANVRGIRVKVPVDHTEETRLKF